MAVAYVSDATMDAYPQGTLGHSVPFIVASGLTSTVPDDDHHHDEPLDGERTRIESQIAPLESKEADVLHEYFGQIDARGASWTLPEKDEPYRYRIASVGRVGRPLAPG